jgi:chemotaxis protein methyltransferase WspC
VKPGVHDLAKALSTWAHLDPALVTRERLAPLVAERRSALRASSDTAYVERALADPAELGHLRDLVTVPETWLFRYPASFELLRDRLRARGATTLRALSVACATGAEPCSIAATAFAAGVPCAGVEILAMDPSAAALERARAGAFTRLAARDGLPPWAEPWFEASDGCLKAAPSLLAPITWVAEAVPAGLEHLPRGSFDAIFCRNLAIYLGPEARRALGPALRALLAPDGLLFLGHAEPPTILGIGAHVVPVEPRASFAFAPPSEETREATACPEVRRTGVRGRGASAASPAPAHARRAVSHGSRSPSAAEPASRRPARPPARPSPPGGAADVPPLDAVRAAADAGDSDRALALGGARLDAGDRSPELLLVLGSTHAARGEHAAAERLLRQATYLEPNLAEALLQLAELAARRGDTAMAERYRSRAARSRADHGATGNGSAP